MSRKFEVSSYTWLLIKTEFLASKNAQNFPSKSRIWVLNKEVLYTLICSCGKLGLSS